MTDFTQYSLPWRFGGKTTRCYILDDGKTHEIYERYNILDANDKLVADVPNEQVAQHIVRMVNEEKRLVRDLKITMIPSKGAIKVEIEYGKVIVSEPSSPHGP